MSIIGMPKKDRTGKGWIGFGSANAEPNDQGRQLLSEKIKDSKNSYGEFFNAARVSINTILKLLTHL